MIPTYSIYILINLTPMDPAADPPNAAEPEVPEVDAAHRVIDRVSV